MDFVFGATYGAGIASCKNESGVFADSFYVTLAGGSWGAQIGAQSTDLLLVMLEKDSKAEILSNAGVKLGAQGSLALGPIGRDVSANTNLNFKEGTLSYSTTRGLFAGVTLNGAKLNHDGKAEGYLNSSQDVQAALAKFETTLNGADANSGSVAIPTSTSDATDSANGSAAPTVAVPTNAFPSSAVPIPTATPNN